MEEVMISVANFSRYPSGRDAQDGSFNGQTFRETILLPALKKSAEDGATICVSLEGVMSFGSSFLEEAFGGLVRKEGYSKEYLKQHLRIDEGKPSFARYKRTIWAYVDGAL